MVNGRNEFPPSKVASEGLTLAIYILLLYEYVLSIRLSYNLVVFYFSDFKLQ